MGTIRRIINSLIGEERHWTHYEKYGNGWERIDTHQAYTIEEEGENYVIIDKYQIHEYFHSGVSETKLSGFKTGSHKIDDPGNVDGEIGGTFKMYIMGVAEQDYVPLDSFDREVTIT
jgi:hypothetical protein